MIILFYIRIICLITLAFHVDLITSNFHSHCTTTCTITGMICVDGRCRCNTNERLFWTGMRCWKCPYSWTMSETSCLHLNIQPMNYQQASDYCHSMQSELFTFRNSDLEPIYTVTQEQQPRRRRRRRRKRQVSGTVEQRTIGWTSAHAVDFSDLGLYEWAEPDLPPFDRTDPSWCQTDTVGLGYFHPFDEPTQRRIGDEMEHCVIFRRGRTITPMYCLDDVFCSELYSVVCERSEFSIIKFHDVLDGNHPRNNNPSSSYRSSSPVYHSSTNSALRPGSSKPSSIAGGIHTTTKKTLVIQKINTTFNENTGSNKDPHLTDAMGLKGDSARAKRKLQTVVLWIIALFLLVIIIAVIIYFLKCRRNQVRRVRSDGPRLSKIDSLPAGEIPELSEISTAVDDQPTVEQPPIIPTQPAKPKRAGLTKQQFDEFE